MGEQVHQYYVLYIVFVEGSEGHGGDPSLKGQQVGLVVAAALGEDADALPVGKSGVYVPVDMSLVDN